jgi:hypothetical protein
MFLHGSPPYDEVFEFEVGELDKDIEPEAPHHASEVEVSDDEGFKEVVHRFSFQRKMPTDRGGLNECLEL